MKPMRVLPLVVSAAMLLFLGACTGIPTLLAATPASNQPQWSQVTTPAALDRQSDIVTPEAGSLIPKQDPTAKPSNGTGNVSQPPVDVSTALPPQSPALALPQTGSNIVQVTLTEYAILMPAALPAGHTLFKVTNAGVTPSRLVLEGQAVSAELESLLEPGDTSNLEVELDPGPYAFYTVDGESTAQRVRLEILVTSPAGPGPTATEAGSPVLTATIMMTATGVTTSTQSIPPTETATPGGSGAEATGQPTVMVETLLPAPTNQPTPLDPEGTSGPTRQATPEPPGTGAPTAQPSITPGAPTTGEPPQDVTAPEGEKTYLPLTGSDLTGRPTGGSAGQTTAGPNAVFIPFTGSSIAPGAAQSEATSTPMVVQIDLAASGGQFDQQEIVVPAGTPVEIHFSNSDAIPHNFSVYREGNVLETIFVGPVALPTQASTIYQFNAPSEPGTYYFRCDSHPFSMVGRLEVR